MVVHRITMNICRSRHAELSPEVHEEAATGAGLKVGSTRTFSMQHGEL
jgi:hypothetical protein